MKHIWKTLIAVFVIALALTSCGGNPGAAKEAAKADFIGTWEIVSITEDGELLPEEDLALMKSLGYSVYLELAEDGVATYEIFGEPTAGTWEATETGKGTITVEGDTVPMTITEGQLVMEQDDNSHVFERIDPADKVKPLVSEDETDEGEDEGFAEYYGGETIDDLEEAEDFDDVVAIDDESFRIALLAKGLYADAPAFLFELENKTDTDVLIMTLDGWTINGIPADAMLYETLWAGETLSSILSFESVEVEGLSRITNIAGPIGIYDADNPDDPIETLDVTLDVPTETVTAGDDAIEPGEPETPDDSAEEAWESAG